MTQHDDHVELFYFLQQECAPGLAEHEAYCESAWLRAAEYDSEAYDEMVRDDLVGRS